MKQSTAVHTPPLNLHWSLLIGRSDHCFCPGWGPWIVGGLTQSRWGGFCHSLALGPAMPSKRASHVESKISRDVIKSIADDHQGIVMAIDWDVLSTGTVPMRCIAYCDDHARWCQVGPLWIENDALCRCGDICEQSWQHVLASSAIWHQAHSSCNVLNNDKDYKTALQNQD